MQSGYVHTLQWTDLCVLRHVLAGRPVILGLPSRKEGPSSTVFHFHSTPSAVYLRVLPALNTRYRLENKKDSALSTGLTLLTPYGSQGCAQCLSISLEPQ